MRAALRIGVALIDRQMAGLIADVAAWPEANQEFRPAPAAWNARQVIHHLVLVHEGIVLGLERCPIPVPADRRPSWWRFEILRVVLRSRIRVRAPIARVVPVEDVPFNVLADRWRAAQARLRTLLGDRGRRWGDGMVVRHPLAGWFSASQTVVFLGDHLAHHERQLRRLRSARTV
ncbi:MAG: DinB family protein [Gemmatimonadales bacterium]